MPQFCRSLTQLFRRRYQSGSVFSIQQTLSSVSDSNLVARAFDLRDRLQSGQDESTLANETFSILREAARRHLGIEHRQNQLEAAWHLLKRRVVELPTGEGKTLAATPALALKAFAGRGVWLATANDYLARRDAATMQGVFERLGLTTGHLQSDHTPDERRAAYACDITYGTIREFGFDFLRDRLGARRNATSSSPEQRLQRSRYSLIVDEADSILLDDARTPLIISEPRERLASHPIFQWSNAAGRRLRENVHFIPDPQSTSIWLTEEGRSRVRSFATHKILALLTLPEAYESVVRAVEAERTFQLNRDYVIREGQIVIVDRLNGRLAEGRQWQHGIQQALQSANDLEITPETNPIAKVTIQSFLRGFEHLSGMTGTAREAAGEFRETYRMRNVIIPPFRPCQRVELAPQVCRTRDEKWKAVIAAVKEMKVQKRPVLIGTRDLNASEQLSDHLCAEGIRHQVLTAKHEAEEAELISHAGEENVVTVSTSIAGRGTDIRLGNGVAESGGLHVIAADLFDSTRIDRQLAGRGGRQGDPATYQQILSLEDNVLQTAWDEVSCRRRTQRHLSTGQSARLALLRKAQRTIECRHALARRELLAQDRERTKRHRDLGFDPVLDDVES